MRLSELTLKEAVKEATDKLGTYAGVRFSTASINNVETYIKNNKIPNPVAGPKMHTTLLYSRKHCPKFEATEKYENPMVGKPTEFDVWESQPDEDNDGKTARCLVLEYDCEELDQRHENLMGQHDATYDFPEYKTHITLSYDIGDMDIKDLPKFTDDLEIVGEYGEDLNTDWAKENANDSK